MSKRLTFYSSTKPALRHFSGGPSGCSEDALSEVQKVRSLPINRVKPLSSGASAAPYYGGWSDFPSLDAPGYRPYYLVGSTDIAGHDAGWTEVVIPGGLPVLGNLSGCVKTAILFSSRGCKSNAFKIGLDRRNFDGACYKDNCISRSPGVTEGSEFSCPTNNEVT
jgi:hypothetical protein